MGVSGAGEIVQQEYEPPTLPSGFIFKFALLSTWDDRFYIGLNGLELYDQFDRIVPITTDTLHVVCTGGVGLPRLLLPRVGCADVRHARASIRRAHPGLRGGREWAQLR